MTDQQMDRNAKESSVRILRRVVKSVLPFVGVLMVIGAVLFLRELRLQMAVVVGGLLLVEIGVWKCAQNILPSERKFDSLRFEIESFIKLVRQLNTVALELKETPSSERYQTFEDIRESMRQSVERMADVAGKTDAEIAEGIANTVARGDHQNTDSGTVS